MKTGIVLATFKRSGCCPVESEILKIMESGEQISSFNKWRILVGMLFGPDALLTLSDAMIDFISSSLHSLNTTELQSGLVRYSVKDFVPVNFLLFRISSAMVEKYQMRTYARCEHIRFSYDACN